MPIGVGRPAYLSSPQRFFQEWVLTGLMVLSKTLGASRVAASLYMGPLYGSLVAWLFLGETLGWHHAMGAAMILPGIYLASQKPAMQ